MDNDVKILSASRWTFPKRSFPAIDKVAVAKVRNSANETGSQNASTAEIGRWRQSNFTVQIFSAKRRQIANSKRESGDGGYAPCECGYGHGAMQSSNASAVMGKCVYANGAMASSCNRAMQAPASANRANGQCESGDGGYARCKSTVLREGFFGPKKREGNPIS